MAIILLNKMMISCYLRNFMMVIPGHAFGIHHESAGLPPARDERKTRCQSWEPGGSGAFFFKHLAWSEKYVGLPEFMDHHFLMLR